MLSANMKKLLLTVVVLFQLQAFAIVKQSETDRDLECDQVQLGGVVRQGIGQIAIRPGELLGRFYIVPIDENLKITGPLTDSAYQEYVGDNHYIYRFTGEPARILFSALKNYYDRHDPNSCRYVKFEGGVIYAQGVTCREGETLNFGALHSCTAVVYGEGLNSSASALISLPRPRIGAGN